MKFPIQLNMYPYTTQGRADHHNHDQTPQLHMYDLSAVVVHKGKMDSGHYICYCREGNDWFMFDDSKVVLVSETEVLEANAYLLFYIVRWLGD